MSCCGKSSRVRSFTEGTNTWIPDLANNEIMQPGNQNAEKPVMFKYTGNTALTAFGAVTRRRYKFPEPGSTSEVAFADSFSMIAVPHLKKV